MAGGTRELKRRIKSVGNTKKITRAMEMVSASKMRRAVASVLAIRPYARSAWSILTNMARAFENYETPLLAAREVKNICVIVITSNKGLCGGFNAQVLKKIAGQIKNPSLLKVNRVGDRRIESKTPDRDVNIDFVTVGKKGAGLVAKLGKKIIATFDELTYAPKIENIRSLAKLIIDDYSAERYDKVVIAYTDYVSTVTQQPKLRQLLPVSRMDLEKQLAEMDTHAEELGLEEPPMEYKVEPDARTILENILPRLVEMQIYHAILESNASKESARMMAMRNATDAADEMMDNLTLVFNQMRQAGITQEIAEISAGRAALES